MMQIPKGTCEPRGDAREGCKSRLATGKTLLYSQVLSPQTRILCPERPAFIKNTYD